MNIIRKILLSMIILALVALGTALSFVPFYNRTPFRLSIGIILAIILYIGLLKSLVWRKENKK